MQARLSDQICELLAKSAACDLLIRITLAL